MKFFRVFYHIYGSQFANERIDHAIGWGTFGCENIEEAELLANHILPIIPLQFKIRKIIELEFKKIKYGFCRNTYIKCDRGYHRFFFKDIPIYAPKIISKNPVIIEEVYEI